MLIKDQAICLRAMEYSETSQIVTLLTRSHGRIQAIAKGARRPKSSFGGTIERFSRGHIVYLPNENSSLVTLREFHQMYDLVLIMSRHLEAYHCALLGTELLTKLMHDDDPHEALFDAFVQYLQDLGHPTSPDTARRDCLGLLIVFQLSLLREVGLYPMFSRCLNCKAAISPCQTVVFFSHSANGLVCHDCEMSFPDRMAVSGEVMGCLAQISRISGASVQTLLQVETLIIDHFTYLLHTRPKTAKWVLDMTLAK
ncbi:MAG: DNA repair protein RecO [Phycisphaerae bacterium]|nr:DNA repair protein RecO [Phycisphaerae bacterium]